MTTIREQVDAAYSNGHIENVLTEWFVVDRFGIRACTLDASVAWAMLTNGELALNEAHPYGQDRTIYNIVERPPTHRVKVWREVFGFITNGAKNFVLCADGPFGVGDTIIMQEFDPYAMAYTGRTVDGTITYISGTHEGLRPGYVAIGFTRAG